jgi:hypothetical protein
MENNRFGTPLNDAEDEVEQDETRVVQMLRRWEAPQPTEQATVQLMKVLAAEMSIVRSSASQRLTASWPLWVLLSQVRVVRSEIWLASVLVTVLGTFVTLTNYHSDGMLPLVFLTPLVSAGGIALLYDSALLPVLELEDTTLVPARVLLLARLTLVFGFNLALALAGSVMLVAVRVDLSLWPLVMSWLAPMTFLSALAFFFSIWFANTLAGMLFGLVIWSVHVIMRSMPVQHTFWEWISMPGLSAPDYRWLLFVSGGVLVSAALWLVGTLERPIGEAN